MNTYSNIITGNKLMWCEYCHAAEDTAKLWKLECTAPRHKFTMSEIPGELTRDTRQRTEDGRITRTGFKANGEML